VKQHIQELISQALHDLRRDGVLPDHLDPEIRIERCRNPDHGDYACNIAMVIAAEVGMNPRELAETINARLRESRHVARVEVAAPGFLNFELSLLCLVNGVKEVLARGDEYGRKPAGSTARVTLEFVSANPTGPLHVGHGRGAAYGASLAAILEAAGFDVHREYYVNDHGRQMDILAVSVWLRYLELCGEQAGFPANGYRGEYVYEIARMVRKQQGDRLRFSPAKVTDGLPPDEPEGGDREKYIDALIQRARELLGEDGFAACFEVALNAMIEEIRGDLEAFGVVFNRWFSERELEESGAIKQATESLRAAGHLYEQAGALWFEATQFGDEKDRVVVRENGRSTYFASDIAYVANKLARGFDPAIYVFGADHHGYIKRLKAAAAGLGYAPESIEILLVQFAVLRRGKNKIPMSTRKGEFYTLRQLREEVGGDAARFFYVQRSHEQHLDFDVELAKTQGQDNPVYYIQYAHARIASVFRMLEQEGLQHNQAIGMAALKALESPHERKLLRTLGRYPEVIEKAAAMRSPHILAHYLHELATDFHTYYNAEKFIVDDENLRNARLNLCLAVAQVIRNGLALLGVSAPESM